MGITSETLIPTRVTLSLGQREVLADAATREKTSVSDLVRRAIDSFLVRIPNAAKEANGGT